MPHTDIKHHDTPNFRGSLLCFFENNVKMLQAYLEENQGMILLHGVPPIQRCSLRYDFHCLETLLAKVEKKFQNDLVFMEDVEIPYSLDNQPILMRYNEVDGKRREVFFESGQDFVQKVTSVIDLGFSPEDLLEFITLSGRLINAMKKDIHSWDQKSNNHKDLQNLLRNLRINA